MGHRYHTIMNPIRVTKITPGKPVRAENIRVYIFKGTENSRYPPIKCIKTKVVMPTNTDCVIDFLILPLFIAKTI